MKLKVITNDSDVSKTKLPCDSCHTNCCKEYVIFVNAHDIYRLSVGLGLDPESFLEIYGAKDYDLGIKVNEGLKMAIPDCKVIAEESLPHSKSTSW